MQIHNWQSMIELIKYVYATIILHNLCVKTPYINDWIVDENNSDTKSKDEPLLHDGLNVTIDADEDSSRNAEFIITCIINSCVKFKNNNFIISCIVNLLL
jgi:hypothetical protein